MASPVFSHSLKSPTMFGHFQRNTQILRLIRLEFGWRNPIKAESWKNCAESFGI